MRRPQPVGSPWTSSWHSFIDEPVCRAEFGKVAKRRSYVSQRPVSSGIQRNATESRKPQVWTVRGFKTEGTNARMRVLTARRPR